MLIGLTGKKRSGKDTFAAALVAHHGFERVAFADPLKEAVYALDQHVVIEEDETGPLNMAQDDVTFYGSEVVGLAFLVDTVGWEVAKGVRDVRRAIQRLGVAVRNLDPDFWMIMTEVAVSDLLAEGRNVVVTDVRFPNELEMVKRLGGIHVHIDRPDLVTEDQHISETALEDMYYQSDVLVSNDASIANLVAYADSLANLTTETWDT